MKGHIHYTVAQGEHNMIAEITPVLTIQVNDLLKSEGETSFAKNRWNEL